MICQDLPPETILDKNILSISMTLSNSIEETVFLWNLRYCVRLVKNSSCASNCKFESIDDYFNWTPLTPPPAPRDPPSTPNGHNHTAEWKLYGYRRLVNSLSQLIITWPQLNMSGLVAVSRFPRKKTVDHAFDGRGQTLNAFSLFIREK